MGATFKQSLIFFKAVTPTHPGYAKGALDFVDQPVQRDEFGFPCIWASSLKGAVRSMLSRTQESNACLKLALGPPPTEAHEHSSLTSFLDVRLLLFPTRSLKGVWTYVTSPHFIGYLATYLEALGKNDKATQLLQNLRNISIPATSRKDILLDGQLAILNELDVKDIKIDENLPKSLFEKILPEELLAHVKSRGVVLVEDDLIVDLVRRGMFIQYRVRLKENEKTVDQGPWLEEYIPQETILFTALICRPLLKNEKCSEPCDWLYNNLKNKVLWLGGNETLGKGLLKLYLVDA